MSIIDVIIWITKVEIINGRPGLRMAVRRRPMSIGYLPTVADCGAM